MSEFEDWFVAQHGKRPSHISTALLRDRVVSERIILKNDESLLERLEEWDERHTSALWAWQAARKGRSA